MKCICTVISGKICCVPLNNLSGVHEYSYKIFHFSHTRSGFPFFFFIISHVSVPVRGIDNNKQSHADL